MKKLLLGLGSVAAVIAPVAAVISCGDDTKTTTNKDTTPGTGAGTTTNAFTVSGVAAGTASVEFIGTVGTKLTDAQAESLYTALNAHANHATITHVMVSAHASATSTDIKTISFAATTANKAAFLTAAKTPTFVTAGTGNGGNTGGNGGTVVTPTDIAEGTVLNTVSDFNAGFGAAIANAAKAATAATYHGMVAQGTLTDVPAITNPTVDTTTTEGRALISAIGGYTAVKKFTNGDNTIFLLTKGSDVRVNVTKQTAANAMEITYHSSVSRPRAAGIEADFGSDAYNYITNNQNVVGMLAFYNGANTETGVTSLYAQKVYFVAGFKNDTTQNKVFVESAQADLGSVEVSITAKTA